MTDLERALAAGAKPVEQGQTDLERAMAAGAKPVPEGSQAIAAGLGLRDMGPTARRAQSGGAPGPRSYSDDELGISGEPVVRDRLFAATKRGAVYDKPRTVSDQEEHNRQMAKGELGGDPTAQFVVGGILGGGAGKLAQGIATGLGAAAPVARVAGAATAGGVSEAQQGGDLVHGAVVGTALAAAPEVANEVPRGVKSGAANLRRVIRDPRRELGRSIEGLDKAKASGITEQPDFQALRKGAPGVNQAAIEAENAIAGRNEEQLAQARSQYGTDQSAFLEKHGNRHYDVQKIHGALDAINAENTVNGVAADEGLAKATAKVRQMLTTDTGVPDSRATAMALEQNPKAPPVTVTAPAVTVSDLLKTKRLVDSLAEHGMPATPENVPYRKLSAALRAEVANVDPELSALNQRYHEAMSKAEETNLTMYGKDAPQIVRTPAKQRQASGMLGRIGDNTQAATLSEPQVERLRALDPGNASDIARVEAKKAIEQTRFGLPHVSRRIEHMPFGFIQQNASALAARVLDPALERLSRIYQPNVPVATSPEAIAAGLGQRRRTENQR